MLEMLKSLTAGKKSIYFIVLTFLLMFVYQGCSKEENPSGGGNSTDCQLVAKSPGTWDIYLEFGEAGDPKGYNSMSIVQSGCTVTMSRTEPGGTVTITGPLSNTGVWTAAVTETQGTSTYTANFTGTFGGGPPYTTLNITSGSDSEGDTISGGSGEITP